MLYIFWILHQTTTIALAGKPRVCCISFESYIKPQLRAFHARSKTVVYLLNPTSNHNLSHRFTEWARLYIFWILHQTTTCCQSCLSAGCCISFESYIKPQRYGLLFYRIAVVYLLNPTSNHNLCSDWFIGRLLYIFWILHQTTTLYLLYIYSLSCISFESYIKPQLILICSVKLHVVYLLNPTSNHNRLLSCSRCSAVVYLLNPTSNHNSFY